MADAALSDGRSDGGKSGRERRPAKSVGAVDALTTSGHRTSMERVPVNR